MYRQTNTVDNEEIQWCYWLAEQPTKTIAKGTLSISQWDMVDYVVA